MSNNDSKAVDDLEVGDTVMYPCQTSNGNAVEMPRTITSILEYPANRVLYFASPGGFGIVARSAAPLDLVSEAVSA